MIRFVCPACAKTLKVPDNSAGKKGPCPQCGQRLQVPTPPRNKTVLGQMPQEADWHNEPLGCQEVPSRDVCRPYDEPVRTPSFSSSVPEYEYGSADPKHSSLGVASFLIAVLVGGMDLFMVAMFLSQLPADKSTPDRLLMQLKFGSALLNCFNFLSVPACLIGVGLAVAGLVAQSRCKQHFSWFGLVVNGTIILSVILLHMASSYSSPSQERTMTPKAETALAPEVNEEAKKVTGITELRRHVWWQRTPSERQIREILAQINALKYNQILLVRKDTSYVGPTDFGDRCEGLLPFNFGILANGETNVELCILSVRDRMDRILKDPRAILSAWHDLANQAHASEEQFRRTGVGNANLDIYNVKLPHR